MMRSAAIGARRALQSGGTPTGARYIRRAAKAVQVRWAGGSGSKWEKWKEELRVNAQETLAASEWVKENGSPYAVLGLKEDAPIEEVKAAYRRLSLTAHPDKGGSLEEFQKIQFAHSIISKGVYQKGDRMGFESMGNKKGGIKWLVLIIGLGVLAALFVLNIVFSILGWFLVKIGLMSPKQPPALPDAPTSSLRDEVKKLQESVDQLHESLNEVKDQLKKVRSRKL